MRRGVRTRSRLLAAALAFVLGACSSRSVGPASSASSAATTVSPGSSTSTCTSTSVAPSTSTTATVPVATTVNPTAPPTTPTTTSVPPASPSAMVWQLPTTGRQVAITFDAGSDLGYTSMILDTLAAEHVVASFGITGSWADAHPDAVRRMAAEGHQIINHGYSHRSFTGASATDPLLSRADRLADLAHAEAVLHGLTDRACQPYWRPPYGDTDASVLRDVAVAGYRYTVMWTVDSHGWMGLSADGIVERILTSVSPGAILAFHVGSASQDGPALARVIDGLRAAGYTFVSVAQGIDG